MQQVMDAVPALLLISAGERFATSGGHARCLRILILSFLAGGEDAASV